MKGQGGGGTARGGGKNRSGGGSITIKKSKPMQSNENTLKLRAALFNDQGKDKDVTAGIAKSFLTYDKNELAIDVMFSPKLSDEEVDWAFELTRENMEEIYDSSGYGWDDDDKERELSEQGARYLLLKDRGTQKLVGFVHFRFTVQGEVIDQMAGAACVYILDLHIEETYQRKGLGRHLLLLLELIGRREQMSRVSLPVYLTDAKVKNWVTTKCKGFAVDTSYGEIGFDAEAEGFEVYSKIFPVVLPKPVVPAPVAVLPPAVPAASAVTTTITTAAAILPPVPPNDTNKAQQQEEDNDDDYEDYDDDEEGMEVKVDDVMAELRKCYIQDHDGQLPDEQTVAQWREELDSFQKFTFDKKL